MATATRERAKTKTRARGSGAARRARAFGPDQAVALAQSVSGSRQQFAEAFRAAQAGRREVLELEAVASGTADATSAFMRGFVRAAELGWLNELCVACLNAQIVDAGFVAVAAGVSDDPRFAKLQQIVDGHRGISDAGLLIDRLPGAMRQVCRIEIDGSDLVMTAYHVIRPLLQPDNSASAGSSARLKVRFDFSRRLGAGGEVILVEGLACRVAEDWLVKTSPCTYDEVLDLLPADLEQLQGFWDFAVIRLADPPGVAREGLKVANVPVKPGHRLMILQHPKTRPVGVDSSTVRRFLGTGAFRIVHGVNTEDGSSGSPCLNDDFEVVGLHQAAMPEAKKGKKIEEQKENRAVPMPRILSFWDPKTAPPPAARFGRVLTIDTKAITDHPVFGRGRFQEWVARSAVDGGKGSLRDRFMAVSGSKGAGKSFTIDVLRGMLPVGSHSVLECRASDFASETTALGFATKYLLSPIGADASTLPGLGQANTSDNAWLTYQLIGDLLNVLDQARKGRMIWVVLDELDQVALPDQGQVRKLLDLLYDRADKTPWMRFVLLGLEVVPVPSAAPLTERDSAGPASEASLATDVGDYLMRRLDGRGTPAPEAFVRATATHNVQQWIAGAKGRVDQQPDLMRTAAAEIIRFETQLGLRSVAST
jgi:Trypsin-like peptidase domain